MKSFGPSTSIVILGAYVHSVKTKHLIHCVYAYQYILYYTNSFNLINSSCETIV